MQPSLGNGWTQLRCHLNFRIHFGFTPDSGLKP